MKKIFMIGLFFSVIMLSGLSYGAPVKTKTLPVVQSKAGTSQMMIYKGTIIDNVCAKSNKKQLAKFIKTHTKECALMPGCVASGYSLYTQGKLIPFDETSNKMIEKFLKEKTSKLDVVVEAQNENNILKLKTIKNQE